MGSSHSAPRRPGLQRHRSDGSIGRVNLRPSQTAGRPNSNNEYTYNAPPEELPSLLEDIGAEEDDEGRDRVSNLSTPFHRASHLDDSFANEDITDPPTYTPSPGNNSTSSSTNNNNSNSRRLTAVAMSGELSSQLLSPPLSNQRLQTQPGQLPTLQPVHITSASSPPPNTSRPVVPVLTPETVGQPYLESHVPFQHTMPPTYVPPITDMDNHHHNMPYMYGSSPDDDTSPPMPVPDFCPQGSRHNEWMGRSLETLVLGYGAVAPVLCLPEDEDDRGEDSSLWGTTRRRSTVSTLGSDFGHRSSLGSFPGSRRGSLVGSGNMHGGTLANYYNRRRGDGNSNSARRGSNPTTRRGSNPPIVSRRGSASHGPSYRRRMSMTRGSETADESRSTNGGPNVALSLLARELTGRMPNRGNMPASSRLRSMGGHTMFAALDRPAGGICSEVVFLSEVIDSGDWAETQTVISRISPRLIGDPAAAMHPPGSQPPAAEDANLPPNASKFYAGGGRLGLERDAFVLAGGVEVLLRIFREPSFVGAEMARTYDARDLSEELVANRLAQCWNETLASLRELVYAIPPLVENEIIFDDGEFVPFLFTLLSHDSCFDGAAALIEEILSIQSHSPVQMANDNDLDRSGYQAVVRVSPPTTFFLGNVPDLYRLWTGFNCRQLAHFCRILALLVFEPEDRQLLESPAVLKSIELLQLRRNRAARAGRDSTVDMNQAILLGDEELSMRLLKLLRVMNFAPSLRRSSSYHVMAHFPFIADTLVMLGLNELDNWDDIDRLDSLARLILKVPGSEHKSLCELGSVAAMLENLNGLLVGNQAEPPANQLGHIIHVITAAQQAGVVVGRPRQGRTRRRASQQDSDNAHEELARANGITRDSVTSDGIASTAGMITDQVMNRGFSDGTSPDGNDMGQGGYRDSFTSNHRRLRVNSADEAANALQFNALLLGPYQVEVLFVLCTLLGGRRKIDAQEMLHAAGIIPILDDMFQRLPWNSLDASRQPFSQTGTEDENNNALDRNGQQPNGIHGPGCECTPESALCVQYLRLLHNFCDRDCDNYIGRRLLLSETERNFIFETPMESDYYSIFDLRPGLLSKIIAAFIGESDESPYRFWLASCVESYLRGSSPAEQVFVARTGLLDHLIEDIASERLHCAGSLQTSFDLLGELCKGNSFVLRLLVTGLDEEKFRKLMSVAAANLVDSNVFIRSLLLSLERMSSSNSLMPLHLDPGQFAGRHGGHWRSNNGVFSRAYLTHSWWDSCLVNMNELDNEIKISQSPEEYKADARRPSDWFPTLGTINVYGMVPPKVSKGPPVALHNGVGHFGWVFTPDGESLSPAAHAPNTVERLSWFLAANQTRLLRDLLGVVDLTNINHENICCLNTAVVVAIFAYRRQQLDTLLEDLRRMNDEERETKMLALDAVRNDDVVDRAFVQAMKYMDIDRETPPAPYSRRASLTQRNSITIGTSNEVDRNDVLRNFREVLWFWIEYYTHRGRDRLSLEFSSHVRFQEWIEVVSLLGADNGSPTSLVRAPIRLPRSPYQQAARIGRSG
eukprot:Nitzschia sp. Nitz4//scaffold166_size90379//57971//62599//NITZ4_005064-RA/size90379-processed-gene-0.62-mRNA-1//-1//CDS//3329538217//8760//frame0